MFREDGTLWMKTSGFEKNGTHWSGAIEFPPGHPDYALWKWILARSGQYKNLMTDEDLKQIREDFARDV